MEMFTEEAKALGFIVNKFGKGYCLTEYTGDSVDVIIPDSIDGVAVIEINKHCFKDKDLESVMLPKHLKFIHERAFENTKLTKVDIPSRVEVIHYKAFANCNIKEVTFNNKQFMEICKKAFYNNLIENLEFKGGLFELSYEAFGLNALESVKIDKAQYQGNPFTSNPYVKFYLNDIAGETGANNNYLAYPKQVRELKGTCLVAGNNTGEMPFDTVAISTAAFKGAQLKEFTPSDYLSYIGTESLEACGLGIIHLPDSLKEIDKEAFGRKDPVLPIIKANKGTYAYNAAIKNGWLDNKDKPTSMLTGSNIFG